MKLLVGDGGRIDFSSPMEMTEQQRQEFVDFLKTIFEPSVIKDVEVSGFREKRLGDLKVYPTIWSDEEQDYMLTSYKNVQELSEALGRTWMAVDMRYGLLLTEFSVWKIKNNKTQTSNNFKELVKEFLLEFKTPKEVSELVEKIKQIHQWFFYIKTDNDVLYNKLNPKPKESTFKKTIRLLKMSDEFKAKYNEYFYG